MKPVKTHDSSENDEMSEDEEAASQEGSEDEELGEEEEEDDEEMAEGGQNQPAGENSASEDSLEANKSDRHLYPTPPPDDGSKMAPLDALVKSKQKPKTEGVKKNLPYISLAIMAIEKLRERSGSSVMAIMKYLKENGHAFEDEKRAMRTMNKALKLGVSTGQLMMVKRSFKLTEASKKASTAVEKMKAKKAKQLAKEKEKEKLKKTKADEKEKEKVKKKATKKAEKDEAKSAAKKEKPGKPSERKTNQATKKKPEGGTKDAPPKAKAAASVAARALLDTPTEEKPDKKTAKAKAKAKANNTAEATTSKKPRKSIGTLAQTKTSKPNVKAVKKLVAAKAVASMDDGDIGEFTDAQATSTPQAAGMGKRKRKL